MTRLCRALAWCSGDGLFVLFECAFYWSMTQRETQHRPACFLGTGVVFGVRFHVGGVFPESWWCSFLILDCFPCRGRAVSPALTWALQYQSRAECSCIQIQVTPGSSADCFGFGFTLQFWTILNRAVCFLWLWVTFLQWPSRDVFYVWNWHGNAGEFRRTFSF